jgi:hypothetical protein
MKSKSREFAQFDKAMDAILRADPNLFGLVKYITVDRIDYGCSRFVKLSQMTKVCKPLITKDE